MRLAYSPETEQAAQREAVEVGAVVYMLWLCPLNELASPRENCRFRSVKGPAKAFFSSG